MKHRKNWHVSQLLDEQLNMVQHWHSIMLPAISCVVHKENASLRNISWLTEIWSSKTHFYYTIIEKLFWNLRIKICNLSKNKNFPVLLIFLVMSETFLAIFLGFFNYQPTFPALHTLTFKMLISNYFNFISHDYLSFISFCPIFDKIQHVCIIKMLNKLGKGTYSPT